MLILSRHKDESIIITTESGEKIKILIIQTGHKIRLGFEADRKISILREELLNKSI